MRRRFFLLILAVVGFGAWPDAVRGHDVITTKITFDREIIRVLNTRCLSCHRDGGGAFPLGTYEQARPWAKAIQEEVLERTMPPWGAVKGFGEFRNDQALTPEEMELVADWVDGGAPEGEPKDLPQPKDPTQKDQPQSAPPSSPWAAPRDAGKVAVSADYRVARPLKLAGVWPSKVAPNASFQITAELPDGSIQPLLWLQPFKPTYSHAFWFQTPLSLPPGTVVRGVPPGATVDLFPAH